MKEMNKIVQDLKMEIESKNKTQNEGILAMKKLAVQSGTTVASFTSRIWEMKEKISGAEHRRNRFNRC